LEALVRAGACDAFGRRRDLLWELGLVFRPQTVRGESLLLARGRYECVGENRNVLVTSLESLAPLARRVAASDVSGALPRAHHFGSR